MRAATLLAVANAPHARSGGRLGDPRAKMRLLRRSFWAAGGTGTTCPAHWCVPGISRCATTPRAWRFAPVSRPALRRNSQWTLRNWRHCWSRFRGEFCRHRRQFRRRKWMAARVRSCVPVGSGGVGAREGNAVRVDAAGRRRRQRAAAGALFGRDLHAVGGARSGTTHGMRRICRNSAEFESPRRARWNNCRRLATDDRLPASQMLPLMTAVYVDDVIGAVRVCGRDPNPQGTRPASALA